MITRLLTCCRLRCGVTAVIAALCWGVQAAPVGAQEQAGVAVTPPAAAGEYHPPEDPSELLKVDEPMRQFFAQRVSPRASEYERLNQILGAILRPDGLDFAYDAEGTFDARETFRLRRGNCASYAFLVVAVARAFGFDAVFQNIERANRWSRVSDIIVVVQHLDVSVTTNGGTYVIDLEPNVIPHANQDAMLVIGDDTAYAQFYCNIGFDRLVHGQPLESLRYMTLATRIDPRCASAWANRANLHARLGDLAAARASFERSLRANSRGEAALEGFVEVLRRLGSPEDLQQAGKLERKVRAIRNRNPYYQEHQAQLARDRGELAAAEKLLRRAISLKDDEPEFYVQWAAVLEQLGRSDEARRATGKLDKLRARLAAIPEHIVP